MPSIFVKIYTYQMMRALAHIHGMGIAHRDIKPQNLLVDPLRHTLKLCDFGSAKALVSNEPNVAYICSRFYRAPELIIGGDAYIPYTSAIDVWSAGCVLCELLLGTPIFPGISAPDQIIEIVKILGTPSEDELLKINVARNELRIPRFLSRPLETVFKNASPDLLELIHHLLVYVPADRVSAIAACAMHTFDELRDQNTVLPDGSPLSEVMWQFSNEELAMASPEVVAKLCPPPPAASDSSNGQSSNGLTAMMKAAAIVGKSEATTAENSSNSLLLPVAANALSSANSPHKGHNASTATLF
jgi:glycogen synthase kinase 3 beta